MNSPTKRLTPKISATLLLFLRAGVLVAVVFLALRHEVPPPKPPPVVQTLPVMTRSLPPPAVTNMISSPAATSAVLANNPNFQERPFPMAYESSKIQWTAADGKDTNIISQLAHNSLEYDRMVEENPRIFRRQLVYLKETAAAVFEQAKLTGEKIQRLTLPGLDGQELQFEIAKGDNKGSSRQGMFSGHLAGNPDSLVSFAFQDGREAFTILSPKKNIFVVGEPREDGQVIVKAIDPNTYGVGPAENADDAVRK
jgi:hypothetical protein